MHHTKKEIQLIGNASVEVEIYQANPNPARVALIQPAMGVRASFYKPLATSLAQTGIAVVSMDLRGLGGSSVRPSSKVDFGYSELADDCHRAAEWIQNEFPQAKRLLIGHSLGGQTGLLSEAKHPGSFDHVCLVASCLLHAKGWKGKYRAGIWMANLVYPVVASMLGYFPGKVMGLGGTEAKTVIKDWASIIPKGKFRLRNDEFNYEEGLQKLETPITAISFEADWLAPKDSVANFLAKVPNSHQKEHFHLSGTEYGNEKLNHFTWAKTPAWLVNYISSL